MGKKNYLVEGVSGTGKSTVCEELKSRGYQAINGDDELAYKGDPVTGLPTDGFTHENHIWDVAKVKAIVANQDHDVTFFCGGSRNFEAFIDLFDKVFVLEVDADTLNQRLDDRPAHAWGKNPIDRELILRLHQTKEDLPSVGFIIDATVPLQQVADQIVHQIEID